MSTGRPLAELIAEVDKPLTRELAEGVDAEREEAGRDDRPNMPRAWTVDRIARWT